MPSSQKSITSKQPENYKTLFMTLYMQTNNMKHTLTIAALFLLAACGSSSKDKNAVLAEKKAQMEKLKDQEKSLQAEIDKLDTAKKEKPKLVAIETIAPATFTHYIDLQGKVESDKI